MQIEQAIYGEVKGGHGLREASGERALALELASRLDLPDNAPPGAEWSPYLSGFPHRDRYVIAKTFRDPNAPRAGMVLSHALIAPLEEIIVARDLRPVLRCLIDKPAQPDDLAPLSIEAFDEVPPTSPDLSAAARALTTRGQGPVVLAGHENFDTLIASIWWRLWPSIRENFSFRLSFGPTDLVEVPLPAIVCTPISLVARWREYRIIDRFRDTPGSLASKALSGETDASPLVAFAENVGAELPAFTELPLLEQAHRFATADLTSFSNTVAAIRLLERLSPDPRRGESGKRELLDRLVVQLKTAGAADVLTLRNLSLSGFRDAGRVWEMVERWLAENLFGRADDDAFRLVTKDALDGSKSSADWRMAVLQGLEVAVHRRSSAIFAALWRWAAGDPALAEQIWEHIGAGEPIEEGLLLAAPSNLSLAEAKPIVTFAAAHKLYRLHGAAVAAAYPVIEAVRLQCAVEPPSSSEGVKLSLKRAKPADLVAAAVDIDDPRLVPIAGEAVAKKPGLLSTADPLNATVRAIWSAALSQNEGAWKAFADPHSAFYSLLDDHLDRRETPPDLIDHLSTSPLADVSDYPRRQELWGVLAAGSRMRLLCATGAAWLVQVGAGQPVTPVEPPLRDEIVNGAALDALLTDLAKTRVAQGVQVVAALPTFDQSRFRRWLGLVIERGTRLPQIEAEAIGRLAAERRWSQVVDDLLRALRWGRREDVRPALRAAVSLVGLLDRWLLNLTQVTSVEKWDSLLELATDLYPTGPDEDALWERSGGRDADISGGNGRSRWRSALGEIRRGRGPRIEKLLREMKLDYGTNATLRFLSEDREFGGKG